jgi:anti-sigma B factor antagonist
MGPKVDHHNEGDIDIFTVEDGLDVYTAARLKALFAAKFDERRYRLIVNLGRVAWMDDEGLTLLIFTLKRARACGGSLKLVFTQEILFRMFKQTGLIRVFEIHSSVSDAADSFRGKQN